MIVTIGSLLLAFCGLPETYKCYREKKCSLGWPMLLMWLIGELLLIIYAIQIKQYALLTNYIINLVFIAILIYYKDTKLKTTRYYHKDNKAFYTVVADFGDEVVVLREDVNIRLIFKKENFEKYLRPAE